MLHVLEPTQQGISETDRMLAVTLAEIIAMALSHVALREKSQR